MTIPGRPTVRVEYTRRVTVKIAPSLLAADFANLADEVAAVAGDADLLHLDVMDGHFVPNLTFGMPVIASLRAVSDLRFDCHIMTNNPTDHLEGFARAGGDVITVHIEAVPDPEPTFSLAERLGVEVGLVISPPTPFEAVEPFVERCRMLVVMSVHPGFGGQSFMPSVLPKVEQARKWVDSRGLDTDIEIDGGITPETARVAFEAGANVLVAGTSVFGAPDRGAAIRALRDAVQER